MSKPQGKAGRLTYVGKPSRLAPWVAGENASRRVRSDSCRCGHRFSQVQETVHYIAQQLERHRTRTFQEEDSPSLRNTAHISTRNISGIRCARSYRTLWDGSLEGPFPQALRARLRSHRPSGTIKSPKSSLT